MWNDLLTLFLEPSNGLSDTTADLATNGPTTCHPLGRPGTDGLVFKAVVITTRWIDPFYIFRTSS